MRILSKSLTPLVVPADQLALGKSQARVGATPTTDTDPSWIVAAWRLVEVWCQRCFLRGASNYREGVYEIEVTPEDGDLPIMVDHPRTPGASIQSLEKWNDTTGSYDTTTAFRLRPGSRWRPDDDCATYRLTARVTPPVEIPDAVVQGALRTASWLRVYSPADVRSDGLGGTTIPVSVAGAVMRSGAAELLFPFR